MLPKVIKPATPNQKLRMQKRNEAFAKLPREKQRVTIAKDVLLALKAGKFIPASKYLEFWDYFSNRSPNNILAPASTDLSHVLERTKCTVCGIGSLFVAAVKRADNIQFNEVATGMSPYGASATIRRDRLTAYLQPYFTDGELGLIEFYFEGSNTGREASLDGLVAKPDWLAKTPRGRMSAIMRNIIKNKGSFLPDPKWAKR